jgi:mRNA-degrading endonuclease HigB of HigAB toxin-antitoxin module
LKANWASPADVKTAFAKASILKDGHALKANWASPADVKTAFAKASIL